MQSKYTSISKDAKFAIIAAIVSGIILLPVLLHLTSSSSNTSINGVSLISKERTSPYSTDGILMLTQFQTGHDFKKLSATGLQEDDISDFILGQQSVKITTDGNGSPVFTRKTGISPPVDLTDKSLVVWIKVSDPSSLKELRVTVSGDRFQTLRNYWIDTNDGKISTPMMSNKWSVVTIGPENIRDFGSPDMSKIDTIQLRVVDQGGSSPVTIWFNGLATVNTS